MTAFLVTILVLVIHYFPVRVIRDGDRALSLTALGFNYQGQGFTGIVFDTFGGFQLSKLIVIVRGERHGPDLQWFSSGQRFVERHYRNGMESGIHKAWFENGAVRFFKTFKDGVPDGEFFEWHANGQLAQYVLYRNGQEIAAKSWTAGGKPFYNYVYHEARPIGLQGDTFCAPKIKSL